MVEKIVKGSALGFHGPVTVTVGLDNGKILSLEADYSPAARGTVS